MCVKRRVITQALERSTSKNFVASSHQPSPFCRSVASRLPLSSAAGFLVRERRSADVDAQHGAEPRVLAHALVHHVFVNAASARIGLQRSHRKVRVLELTPDAEDLHALGFVGVDQKFVVHHLFEPGGM